MNIDSPLQDSLVSSKEVLNKTAISRATLNNYIKMGILPRPIVQKPLNGSIEAKQIGYFPPMVLDRIQLIKRLKKEGNSMRSIVARFKDEDCADAPVEGKSDAVITRSTNSDLFEMPLQTGVTQLRLTLEEISYPAYLLNYDFEMVWINQNAQTSLFKHTVNLESGITKNIFKLLFNWEFHGHVVNWKDMFFLHMSFAKIKLMKGWMTHLYGGISEREISILEEIYDRAPEASGETVGEAYITLIPKDGAGESYKVVSMLFKEGILFIYIPMDYLSFRMKCR